MIYFKEDKDKDLIFLLHPALLMIFFDMANYARSEHGIDLTVTTTLSTIEEDKALSRVSPAHREARAIDIRTKDIDAFIVQDLIEYINSKDEYAPYRYMSNSGVERLAYYHVGSAEHIHLAIHRKFR